MIGLSFIGLEAIAQQRQGRDRGPDRDRGQRPDRGTTINHRPNQQFNRHHRNGPKRYRNAYAYNRGRETVIIRHRPGIRYTRPVVVRPHVYVRPSYRYGAPGYGSHVYRRVLRTGEVNAIADRMSFVQFDDDALQVAKNRIRKRTIRSEDVAYLMRQLHFEDNKLKLAKFAWSRTIDKRNFNTVFNELRFRSSQRELDRFIGRY